MAKRYLFTSALKKKNKVAILYISVNQEAVYMEKKKLPECTVPASEVARLKGVGFLRDKNTEDKFNCRIITTNGKVTTDFIRNVAEAADKFGSGQIAFTSRMTVEIQGIPYGKSDDFLSFLNERGIESGGTGPKVRPVVSCKGTTCQYGLIDTFALSEEIHKTFYKGYRSVKLPHKFKIAVGGCPNNCVKPDINDLGVIGQRVPDFNDENCTGCSACAKLCPMGAIVMKDGKAVRQEDKCNNCGRCIVFCKKGAITAAKEGAKVYIGGRWGKKVARGIPFDVIFESNEEILSVIEKTLLFYKEKGTAGERFADTIERTDFDNVSAEILGDEILSRKEMILKDE